MQERKYKTRSTIDAHWERHPVVEGVVAEGPRPVKELKGRKVLLVDTGDALVRVFESYDLKDTFLSAKKGDSVRIEFLGQVPTKKAGRTVKKFKSAVWTE